MEAIEDSADQSAAHTSGPSAVAPTTASSNMGSVFASFSAACATARALTASPAPTPLNAAERVFGIPELAEKILLEITDGRTLLLSQRVSQAFRDTIQTSKLLRRELFLEPPAEELRDRRHPHWTSRAMHGSYEEYNSKTTHSNRMNDMVSFTLNNKHALPFIRSDGAYRTAGLGFYDKVPELDAIVGLEATFRDRWRNSVTMHGSWRDMYVSAAPYDMFVVIPSGHFHAWYDSMPLGELIDRVLEDSADGSVMRRLFGTESN